MLSPKLNAGYDSDSIHFLHLSYILNMDMVD